MAAGNFFESLGGAFRGLLGPPGFPRPSQITEIFDQQLWLMDDALIYGVPRIDLPEFQLAQKQKFAAQDVRMDQMQRERQFFADTFGMQMNNTPEEYEAELQKKAAYAKIDQEAHEGYLKQVREMEKRDSATGSAMSLVYGHWQKWAEDTRRAWSASEARKIEAPPSPGLYEPPGLYEWWAEQNHPADYGEYMKHLERWNKEKERYYPGHVHVMANPRLSAGSPMVVRATLEQLLQATIQLGREALGAT